MTDWMNLNGSGGSANATVCNDVDGEKNGDGAIITRTTSKTCRQTDMDYDGAV